MVFSKSVSNGQREVSQKLGGLGDELVAKLQAIQARPTAETRSQETGLTGSSSALSESMFVASRRVSKNISYEAYSC